MQTSTPKAGASCPRPLRLRRAERALPLRRIHGRRSDRRSYEADEAERRRQAAREANALRIVTLVIAILLATMAAVLFGTDPQIADGFFDRLAGEPRGPLW